MKNKISKNINDNEFIDNLLKSIPEQTKRSARISLDIASQINSILKRKNITQRELALRLNKKESEISKWLSGNHNFTIKTLASIETILGEEIISVLN
jgi:ribosome-binding protein aMBF1 (putative translation factor)